MLAPSDYCHIHSVLNGFNDNGTALRSTLRVLLDSHDDE